MGGRGTFRGIPVLAPRATRRVVAGAVGFALAASLAWAQPAPAAKRVDFRGSVGTISIKHKLNSGAKRNRKVVRFRWRVVKSPNGASVRLVGPRRARPRLITKTPGYYRLRLRGIRRSGRKVKRFYRIAVAPQVDPLGLPIETINDDGRIQLGDDVYGASNLRLVLVDRNTLEVSASGYSGTREDFAAMGRKIAEAGPQKLSIVVAVGALDIKTQSDADAFNDNVATPIGAAPISQSELGGPPSRPFSIVGVSGWSPGAAAVNTGDPWRHDEEPQTGKGSISGYIQRVPSTGIYSLAFKDYLDFDTRLPSSGPNDNVMAVGDSVVQASLPAGQSGFHIVRVTSGGIPYGRSVGTNTGNVAQDAANLETARSWVDKAGLVMIQSIGNPRPTTSAWDAFSRAVEDLGGTRPILNGLDGSSGYAFVGGTARPDLAIESVNDSASRQTGTLSGLFARSPSGMLRPTIFDPTGQQTGSELPQLAYSAPTAWPFRDTDGYRAALAYIADQLGLRTSDPRFRYTELNRRFDGDLFSMLKSTNFVDGRGFTQSDFDTVKGQLLKEFRWVGDTVSYYEQTREVLTESTILRQGELNELALKIRDQLAVKGRDGDANSEVPVNALTPWATVFGFMRGDVPGAGLISSSITVAANLTRGPKGMSTIDRLNASAQTLSVELTTRYGAALDTLGLIRSLILTDPRKLEIVGTHIGDSDPGWVWTDAIEAKTRKAMVVAARRTFYGSLLKTTMQTYILPDYASTPSRCRVMGDEEPQQAWFVATEGFDPGPTLNPVRRVRAIGQVRENDRYGKMAADDVLTAPLFKPIPPDLGPEGLGFYRPTFMGRNLDVDYINERNCRQL